MLTDLALAVGNLCLGAVVKFIDAAHDDGAFTKRFTLLFGAITGVAAGTIMSLDRPTFLIFSSIIAGVLITGKIDIWPFRALVVVAVGIPAIATPHAFLFSRSELALVSIFVVAAIVDEIGNDLADRGELSAVPRVFFLFRGLLKVIVILVVVAALGFPARNGVAFLAFDLGYFLVTLESARRIAARERVAP